METRPPGSISKPPWRSVLLGFTEATSNARGAAEVDVSAINVAKINLLAEMNLPDR
jgi:hypothetical protein